MCVAVNPSEGKFELVTKWDRSFSMIDKDRLGNQPTAMMHWHSHAVHHIQYSNDGQFLLSSMKNVCW